MAIAGHAGDTDTARTYLTHEDPGVRASAVAALVRADAITHGELSAAATDPEPSVRRRVATAVATVDWLDTADLEGVTLQLLRDPDDGVAEVAAFALGEIPLTPGIRSSTDISHTTGPEPVVPVRIERLVEVATGHPDALCREAAVASLGALGHQDGLGAILRACDDKATVRRRAVLALAAFDGEAVTAMLVRLRTDRDLQVSQSAEDLLEIESGGEL